MNTHYPSSREILNELIGFDTTSRLPNRALIDYVSNLLATYGIDSTLVPNEDESKANLYCTVGPRDTAGIMLSGHTDVVPIDGQAWSRPAFELTASQLSLRTPLHLGFSYDEEIGCVGVHSLIELLQQSPVKPAMCIVGEPTELKVATKQKGKLSIVARCIGREGHSALAPYALNAIHLATELVTLLRDVQTEIQESSPHDNSNDPGAVPYTTVHVGNIVANQALNIVPNLCVVNFEIRYTANTNPTELLNKIQTASKLIVDNAKQQATEAAIEFDVWNAYPGLDTPSDSQVVELVKSLVGANSTTYVAFGTEAGLFSENIGIPTVICGPGSMEQGHKPDEYIEIDQLNQCDSMLNKLVGILENQTL